MEEQEEIWYDIEEFPHYQISNLKNVRRLPYKVQVEVTVEAAEINPQKSGMVFFFYNWPKRSLTSRNIRLRSFLLLTKKIPHSPKWSVVITVRASAS